MTDIRVGKKAYNRVYIDDIYEGVRVYEDYIAVHKYSADNVRVRVIDTNDWVSEWWGIYDLISLVSRTGTSIAGLDVHMSAKVPYKDRTDMYWVGYVDIRVAVTGNPKNTFARVAALKFAGIAVTPLGGLKCFSKAMVADGVMTMPDFVNFICGECDDSPGVNMLESPFVGVHTLRLPDRFDIVDSLRRVAERNVFPDLKLVEVAGDAEVSFRSLLYIAADFAVSARLKLSGSVEEVQRLEGYSWRKDSLRVYTLEDRSLKYKVDMKNLTVSRAKK